MVAPQLEACPPEGALAAFDTGVVPDTELERIADHLSGCAACREAFARLSPVPDPLVSAVRRYVGRSAVTDRTPEPDADPDFRPTADFPAPNRAPASTEPSQHGGTVVRRSDTPLVPDPDPVLADLPPGLLAPACGPGELGRIASYRVLRKIGQGGMGIVFAAEDTGLQRPVALKVMLPRGASDTRNRERFLREARSAAALTHDHIVPVYQVGEDRGVLFIAMPLLRGESLQARLRRDPPLALADVVRIGAETAAGLAAAHALGLVHRDIKPDNLWLEATETETAFRVKVLDFGLARAAADDGVLTNPGGVIGTPAYMAPEQARAEHVGTRADVFSLGAVLYRAATGRPAFGGRDVPSILYAVCHAAPAAPHELNPSVPLSLSDLIMRMLDKAAANRPTAREVVAALAHPEESLRGAPTAAFVARAPAAPAESVSDVGSAPESWLAPEPPWRVRSRRRRLMSTAAGLFALLLAVGGVVVIEIVGRDGKKTTMTVADGSKVTVDKDGKVTVVLPDQTVPPKAEVPVFGLQRELFTDAELKKPVPDAKAVDPVMQWGWGQLRPGKQIAEGAPFAVRWTGVLSAPKQTDYQFRFLASGGVRVWIDGESVVESEAARTDVTKKVALTAGAHDVKIEYRAGAGRADFAWLWADPVWGGERPVPSSLLFPARDTSRKPHAPANQELLQADEEWRIPPSECVPATAFSSNGRFVGYVADYNPAHILLYDRVEGKQPDRLKAEHRVSDIAFAPDGSVLIAGGKDKDGTLHLWATKNWEVHKLVHGNPVARVSFAPNGKWFASVGADGTAVVWDAETTKSKATLPKAVGAAIGWADGGNRLLTLAADGIPREWNPDGGKKEAEHPRLGDADTTAVTFTADGKAALVASFQKKALTGTVRWVELATGKALGSAPLAVPAGRVAVSPDGRWVATGVSQDWWHKEAKHTAYDAIVLFEVAADRSLREVHRFAGHTKWVDALAFGPDGKTLASGSSDHSWRQWKLPERLFGR